VTCITPPSRLPHREAGTLEYVKHRSVLREYISLEASDPLSRAIVASIEAGLERLAGRIANSKRPLSEGTYMLRSNVHQWTDEELWKTCIQLTEAEAAFRIHKSDLAIRPVWDPKATFSSASWATRCGRPCSLIAAKRFSSIASSSACPIAFAYLRPSKCRPIGVEAKVVVVDDRPLIQQAIANDLLANAQRQPPHQRLQRLVELLSRQNEGGQEHGLDAQEHNRTRADLLHFEQRRLETDGRDGDNKTRAR
jgi:hypothetical protein